MVDFHAHGLTQGGLIEQLARERPDREALIHPARGLRWTFAELAARSLELARGLVAIGIEPGERVTVWADNRPDWIPLQFALARIGAVLVTANTALTQREIAFLLRQSRSSAVIAAPGVRDEEYLDSLEALRSKPGDLPELRHVVVLEARPRSGMLAIDEMVDRGRDVSADEVARRTADTAVDEPANIQYTSGTTGFPKGVVLTHGNVVENAWAMGRALALADDDRVLLQVPLFHCFGCVITVLGAYTHGLPLVALQRFEHEAALSAIESERCTVMNGVPTMFSGLLGNPRFSEYDLSSLRTGIMAGSMCPEALMRRVIDEMGAAGMLVAYGLTEASPAVTSSLPTDAVDVRCSTVGRAIPGVEVRVVDPDTGADRPTGERGELWVRGPNVMQGYFDLPDATAETITPEGWLRTGDLATLDAEGLVRIVGRIKEMIIRGGENVYPAEVEDALRTHADVRDAAVFGIPSEDWGEEVAAALVLEPGAALDAVSIETHLRERLAHFKRPKRLAQVDAFPLTGSGKVQKFRLPELLGWTSDPDDAATGGRTKPVIPFRHPAGPVRAGDALPQVRVSR